MARVFHISSSPSTPSFSQSSMNPQRRDVLVFPLQKQNDQLLQVHEMLARRRRRQRRRQARNVWVRNWMCRRPQQGLYDRLMVEHLLDQLLQQQQAQHHLEQAHLLEEEQLGPYSSSSPGLLWTGPGRLMAFLGRHGQNYGWP